MPPLGIAGMHLFRCQSGVAGAAGLRHIHLVEIIGKLVVIVGKPLHRFSYPCLRRK